MIFKVGDRISTVSHNGVKVDAVVVGFGHKDKFSMSLHTVSNFFCKKCQPRLRPIT